MFFVKSSIFLILAAVLILVASCQGPSLTAPSSKVQVSLQLTWPAPVSSKPSSGGARLLMPNSAWVTVTAVAGTLDTETVSQPITPSGGSAIVNLSLLAGETYKITVNAYTAQGGTLTGSATTSFTVGSGASLASLNLVPPTTIQINSWQPWVDTSFPANGSQTLDFDLSDSTALVLGVPPSGGTAPTLYYQNLDGSPLVPTLTSTGVQTIPVTSLTPGSTGFLMTVYNPTSTTFTPGRGYFDFTLDPTKIGVAVYLLDSGSPAGIDVYTLNEVTGALTLLQTVNLSSATPLNFVLDPGQKRLYVAEAVSSVYALDAYSIGSTGSLTEIGGSPVQVAGAQASAISTGQVLYWVTSSGVESEALTSAGAPQVSSPATVLGGSFTNLAFDAGSDGLWAVGTTSVSFVSPQTPSTGVTKTWNTPTVSTWMLQTDPFIQALFSVQNQTSLQAYESSSSSIAAFGSPYPLPSSAQAFALGPHGQNIYDASSTYLQNIHVNTSGTLSAGVGWNDPATGATLTQLTVDPTGRWVFAVDSAGNLYSLPAPALGTPVSTQYLSTNIVDMAALRYQ